MSGKLDGQAAIVTGGGRGIGRFIALRFAAEGAAVALAATGAQALEACAREIRAAGGRALAIPTDVSDEAAVAAMVKQTVAELGRIDVLVNNAGIAGPTAPATEVPREGWQRTLDINLTGAFLCAKHAAPHMMTRRSGRIVNITSVAGLMGVSYRTPYAASKWGMIGLTRSLALELGEYGITVNAIAPGAVRGDRIDAVIQSRARALGGTAEEIEREFFIEPTALKRMVEPEEIAAMALYFASDEARSVTGETIAVSGGFRI
ncbi:MAG: SDR family NAD(P)-dependent oxidoreductase [Candidatus Eiseniibacteriota bacterium]